MQHGSAAIRVGALAAWVGLVALATAILYAPLWGADWKRVVPAPPESGFARQLDAARYDVTMSEALRASAGQESLDSLAVAAGNDMVFAVQAPMRRDSTFSANVRMHDLTAHESYANSGASRRITTDSLGVGADSLAAQVVRRAQQIPLNEAGPAAPK